MPNLTRSEREAKRQQLTEALEHLMEGLCVSWSEEERFQPSEFVENYEFSLAIELLSAIVTKNAKPLTTDQLREIDGLAEMMNLGANEYVRDLHAYAARLGLK